METQERFLKVGKDEFGARLPRDCRDVPVDYSSDLRCPARQNARCLAIAPARQANIMISTYAEARSALASLPTLEGSPRGVHNQISMCAGIYRSLTTTAGDIKL